MRSPDEITWVHSPEILQSPAYPPDERLTLIAQLWDSLHYAQISLTVEQQEELERRLSRLDQDRLQSVG